MTTAAYETKVIGSSQKSLRRLARATREATQALKELERASLGDVLGRYVLDAGEPVDDAEVISFVRAVLAEFGGDEGLEILVKTQALRAQGGAESHGTPERLQRG
jgi:hypothetical protein